jgi:hypothetical protein
VGLGSHCPGHLEVQATGRVAFWRRRSAARIRRDGRRRRRASVLGVCFPYEFPNTLFDHLVAASYSPYYTRHAGPDWIVYEEPLVFNCWVMVSRDGKSMQCMLRLEAVLAKGADTEATNELWEIFQLLCMSLRQVLRGYPGLLLTSYALDDTLTKRMRLESLFQFPVSARSRKWMPRADVWEWYKALITHTDS